MSDESAVALIRVQWQPEFVMEALPGCFSKSNPPRYQPCTLPEYMEGWYSGEYTTLRSLTEEQVAAAADTDLSAYKELAAAQVSTSRL